MPRLALAGGNEFRDNCRAMDRALLARLAVPRPRVVVLPTAAVRGNPRLAAANGVRYFTALGADAVGPLVVSRADADRADFAAEVRAADLVYLAGGDPPYLLDTLLDTAILAAMRDVLARGGMLAGSSAGAMVLGAFTGPPAGAWRPALALAPRVAVVPHYTPDRADRLAAWRAGLPDDIALLGIPEATAVVTDDGISWEVVGIGDAAVYNQRSAVRYAPRQTFQLP